MTQGSANVAISSMPAGKRRRTARAFSLCKVMVGLLCRRPSVLAAGVSPERAAMRPPSVRHKEVAMGAPPAAAGLSDDRKELNRPPRLLCRTGQIRQWRWP